MYPDMMPFALNCRKAGGGVVCGGAVGGWGEGEGEGLDEGWGGGRDEG